MHLNKCDRDDCSPDEQTRGEMGEGDYADVILAHGFVRPAPHVSAVDHESSLRLHELVEMDDSIKDDVRICCLTCGKATGWNKRDAPGMPGVGVDFTRKLWNEKIVGV